MTETKSETVEQDVQFTLNGKPTTAPARQTIAEYLAARGFRPTMVVVEQNGVIISRDVYATTTINDGDVIEMVHAVGGG